MVKKRLNLDASLYTLLQLLSVTLFEQMPVPHAFPGRDHHFRIGQRLQPTKSIRVLTGHY